jgi:hypothetical protein
MAYAISFCYILCFTFYCIYMILKNVGVNKMSTPYRKPGATAKDPGYYVKPIDFSESIYFPSDDDLIIAVKNIVDNFIDLIAVDGEFKVGNLGGTLMSMIIDGSITILGSTGISVVGDDATNTITISQTGTGGTGGAATSIGGTTLPTTMPTAVGSHFLTYEVPAAGGTPIFKYLNADGLVSAIVASIKSKIPQLKRHEETLTVATSTTYTVTLPSTVDTNTEMVYLNGQYQDNVDDYTLDTDNKTITFSSLVLTSNAKVVVYYQNTSTT